jgi:tetratricopeptide (TPR) repeat protein
MGMRRRSVASFGVLWIAIGLFPVSNVLIPTGIALAERTLFLPSVGIALILGEGLTVIGHRLGRTAPWLRIAAALALAVLLLAGATRSALRYRDWHDMLTFWHQAVEDAPTSYRARAGFGQVMFMVREKRTGERLLRQAIRLYPDGYPTYQILADHYRLANLCEPAIPLYRRALGLAPKAADIRSSLIACQLDVGDYRGASEVAAGGIAEKTWPEMFRGYQHTADSARAVAAPAGTLRIGVPDSVSAAAAPRP